MAIVKMKTESSTVSPQVDIDVRGIDRNGTWLKLYRSIMDTKMWTRHRFSKGQAWIDLLLLAAFKEHETDIRGNKIKLKSGDVIGAVCWLAKRWKWNERTVKKYLNLLVSESMISYKSTTVTTKISILNWSLYQQNTQQNTEQNTEQNLSNYTAEYTTGAEQNTYT